MSTIGYYTITHRPTGRFYIGSSGNLTRRIWRHRTELASGMHTNRKLQEIYTCWDDFEVMTSEVNTLEEARQLEQQLLDRYVGTALCCNSSMSATNPFDVFERIGPSREICIANLEKANEARRGKPLSSEHKAKLSEASKGRVLSPEQRAALIRANTGRKMSDNHREIIIAANTGLKRTSEHKKIISELKSRKVSINGVIYPSLKVASAAVGFSDVTVRKRLNDHVNYKDWFYLD